ncbi:MAG: hypothetical protein IPG50_09530 [Myxococcales bacterium]|nr:hypothetical protein [Myxococcales bacterium]
MTSRRAIGSKESNISNSFVRWFNSGDAGEEAQHDQTKIRIGRDDRVLENVEEFRSESSLVSEVERQRVAQETDGIGNGRSQLREAGHDQVDRRWLARLREPSEESPQPNEVDVIGVEVVLDDADHARRRERRHQLRVITRRGTKA